MSGVNVRRSVVRVFAENCSISLCQLSPSNIIFPCAITRNIVKIRQCNVNTFSYLVVMRGLQVILEICSHQLGSSPTCRHCRHVVLEYFSPGIQIIA